MRMARGAARSTSNARRRVRRRAAAARTGRARWRRAGAGEAREGDMTEGLYECPYCKSPRAEAVTLTWERWRTPLAKWLISRFERRGTLIAIPSMQIESSRASTLRRAPMRRMNWAIGSMLALLLVGGLALDVSAQQPAAPAPPAQTESKPATPPDSGSPASPSAPQPGGQVQTPPVPP